VNRVARQFLSEVAKVAPGITSLQNEDRSWEAPTLQAS